MIDSSAVMNIGRLQKAIKIQLSQLIFFEVSLGYFVTDDKFFKEFKFPSHKL